MSHGSGVISSLAFDQEAHNQESALDVFLQIFPRSAAEFQTAVRPNDVAEIPFPPPLDPRPSNPISCATMGGTWDAVRRRCNPPAAAPFPPPTFPTGPTGGMTPEEDRRAMECAQRGGFYDRTIGQCREETGTPQPGTGPSACAQKCQGNVLTRGACLAACSFGESVAPILVVVIGIILVLVALALIVK